jgi:hypothetical protein
MRRSPSDPRSAAQNHGSAGTKPDAARAAVDEGVSSQAYVSWDVLTC